MGKRAGWLKEKERRRAEKKSRRAAGEGEDKGWGQIKREVCGKMIIFGPEYRGPGYGLG